MFEELASAVVGGEQPLNPLPQAGVGTAGVAQIGVAGRRGNDTQRLLEKGFFPVGRCAHVRVGFSGSIQ